MNILTTGIKYQINSNTNTKKAPIKMVIKALKLQINQTNITTSITTALRSTILIRSELFNDTTSR
jgi:hypothetical protein